MTRNRSSLDPGQIIQSVFNEESLSYDVTIIDTEMAMSLSADEGDSIKTEARSFIKKVKANEEFDVENISKLRIYIKNALNKQIQLQVCPDEGDMFFTMWNYQMNQPAHMSQCIEDVMAKKAKVVCDCDECEIIVVGKGN